MEDTMMTKKLFIGFVVSILAVMFICAHGYSETMTFPVEDSRVDVDRPENAQKESVTVWNPNDLSAAIRNPFDNVAKTLSEVPPDHHRPWGGDWAVDFWVDDVPSNGTCGEDVFLKVSPWVLPGGVLADSMRASVIGQGYACDSRQLTDGGYYQKYRIYATYAGEEVELGWVLIAHIDNLVYSNESDLGDPMKVRVGTVYN